jgi:phage terminase large subunit-like protein
MKTFTDWKFAVQSKMPNYKPFANAEYCDEMLETLARGVIHRAVHSRPSQHGKSTDTDLFAAYCIGINPLERIICATYSQKLARKHSRNIKRILQSPEFREFFGWSPTFLKDAEDDWQIAWEGQGQNATFLARSIESPALGETADLLIIDDPLAGSLAALSETKQDRAWESISNVLMQRLTPEARVLVIATLWTEADPSMKLMEQWRSSKTPSTYLNLAALNPDGKASFRVDIPTGKITYLEPYEVLWHEYRDLAFIEAKQHEMLTEDFETQYQGNPIAGAGSLAPLDCWPEYSDLPGMQCGVLICDTGLEKGDHNDPSCLLGVGFGIDGRAYVLGGRQGRWSMRELILNCYTFYEQVAKICGARNPQEYRLKVPRLIIERAAMGTPLFQEIDTRNGRYGNAFLPVATCDPELTKILRARAQSHKIQSRHVLLPKNWEHLREFKQQWYAFPRGRHDEWVDVLSYSLRFEDLMRRETEVNLIESPNHEMSEAEMVQFALYGRF